MEDYAVVLKQLLPPGKFFEIARENAVQKLLNGLSLPLNRVRDLLNSFEQAFSYASHPDLFLNLLGIPASSFKTTKQKVLAIESILKRRGSLSRGYVEGRLKALGYTSFEITDPSEEDLGLAPNIPTEMIGIVYVRLQAEEVSLAAGFLVGDPLSDWHNYRFENDFRALIPAQIRAQFIYTKENSNAES